MKLIEIDPKKLRDNPENPRRTMAGPEADALLLANVQTVGILQPPTARERDGEVVLIAGHRRRDVAIKAKLKSIHVLIREDSDDVVAGADGVRAFAENIVRANMNPVDQWRAVEALVSEDWTPEAISTAMNMSVRRVNVLRHMTHILPAMLTQMARGDMPTEQQLRTIGLASAEEQASVWKSQKPKRNERANWHMISHGLDKRRVSFTLAKFGAAETEAFGIVWEDDLFAPGDTDPRFTTQVDAFLQAQRSWLEANLPEAGVMLGMDEYYRPQLPPRAQQVYSSRPGPSDTVGYYVNHRTFEVDTVLFRMPEPTQRRASTGGGTGEDYVTPKAVRPDLTQKGEAMVGDLRTEALHAAFAEAEISDHALIGLLVLALAGLNVSVRSGAHGNDVGSGERCSLAAAITEGGVLTADPAALRAAARGMLRQALSCRVGFSSSGTVARIAGIAVDADAWLPTTATEEFLGNLSKAAIERTAITTNVLPRNTGKATRAAIVEHLKGRTFLHPLVRFDFTDEERRQAEANRARAPEMATLRRGGHATDDGAEDEEGIDNPEHLLAGDEEEGPGAGVMPPPGGAGVPAARAV
ncbi:ParB N-terminal domain-containing protein [Roseomonas mucosa]|uniref:ParB N-terminal domain-containing protein n=1 Tax=Roseomonas mucosa TaxID=207340 RepID=UPI0028CF2F1D|nr:ParB N-terminal domain-containing protein [Roseomonas mucosa]MDT8277842.1 ParB N-terminal domain-containing protein [Roseomonas mucosa]